MSRNTTVFFSCRTVVSATPEWAFDFCVGATRGKLKRKLKSWASAKDLEEKRVVCGVELHFEQVKCGCWFLHVQPQTAASWKLEGLRKLVSTSNVEWRRGDQGRFDQSNSQNVAAMNPRWSAQ